MADISEINSSQTVKIVGSSSDGTEQTPIQSNANGNLHTDDISNNGGVEGSLTVGTSAVEAKVGGSSLSNRVELTVYNNSSSIIYYGLTNSVTTSTGTPITKKQLAVFSYGPGTSIYLIAGTAGNNTRITESA